MYMALAKAMYMENYWMVLQPHGNEGFMIRDTSANGTQQVLAQFNGLSGSNNGNVLLAPVWGNVGIGVNNPDQRLSVEGNIEARSGGWFIARSGDNSNYAHIRNPEAAASGFRMCA